MWSVRIISWLRIIKYVILNRSGCCQSLRTKSIKCIISTDIIKLSSSAVIGSSSIGTI